MFDFVDTSDETVKTQFLGHLAVDSAALESASSILARSILVATAVFLLLVTFAGQ